MDKNIHVQNIEKNGYTIIRNAFSKSLADEVVKDFNIWINDDKTFVKNNYNRVTNFHTYNNNTLELVTNSHVNDVIRSFFNSEQVVYSSLTFREGTQQHLHRDTPHFYTNPINLYVGVWYALEDVNRNAGPLRYYKQSHLIDDPDNYKIYNDNYKNDVSYNELNLTCLHIYNKIIEDECKQRKLELVDENNYEQINKGDVIIWHPKLLHGGSSVIDNHLTRYSMVTHNVPVDYAVFNSSSFFTHNPTKDYVENNRSHDYLCFNNVKYFDHKTPPRVQQSYI